MTYTVCQKGEEKHRVPSTGTATAHAGQGTSQECRTSLKAHGSRERRYHCQRGFVRIPKVNTGLQQLSLSLCICSMPCPARPAHMTMLCPYHQSHTAKRLSKCCICRSKLDRSDDRGFYGTSADILGPRLQQIVMSPPCLWWHPQRPRFVGAYM